MKYVLLSLLVLVGIISCQKEITDEVPGLGDTTLLPATGKLEADIDSVHWVADKLTQAVFFPADSFNKASIVIDGSSTDGRDMLLSVIDSSEHNYTLIQGDSANNSASFSDTGTTAFGDYFSNIGPTPGVVGSIIITKIDSVNKTISGTFSCKVYRVDNSVKTFTNGKFTEVPYVTIGDTGLISTDTFRVKYNDTAFTARPGEVGVGSSSISIGIGAKDSSGRRNFDVTLPDTLMPGAYSFDSTAGRYAYYSRDTTVFYRTKANTGILQILEFNSSTKRLRGNFSYIGYNNRNVVDSAKLTEGYFSVEVP